LPGGKVSVAVRIQDALGADFFSVPFPRAAALATASLSSAAGSHTASTRPSFFALSARTSLPCKIIGSASVSPMSFGRAYVPPHPGSSPSLTSGRPSLVLGDVVATR